MKTANAVILPCMLIFSHSSASALSPGTQTDWTGGPGEPGPVSSFDDHFHTGDLAWRAVAGQLALRSLPRAGFPRDVLLADADRPARLAVADVTGDGFADVILSDPLISPFDPENRQGGVYLWQNDGQDNWTSTTITDEFYGAWHVDAIDLDQDGDLDVIASAFYGEIDPPPPPPSARNGRYAWFENLDGVGGAWTKREVGQLFWGANHVAAGDVDGDGDLDLIGCSYLTDGVYEQEADVVWFENEDGGGETWSQHDVSGTFDDAFEVYPVDVDGDTDVDLIASGYDRFEWFENLDGSGDAWTRHVITPTITGAGYFDVGDLDGDGDIDILGSGINTSVLAVWKNNGTGTSWGSFIVGPFPRGYNVDLADIDGDGDLDAVAAKEAGNIHGQVAWAENLGDGTQWTLTYVDVLAPRHPWARAGDVDRDGKPELVASFEDSYDVGIQLAAYTLTDFVSDGTLRSSILDGGASPDWGAISWDADVPATTSLAVDVRGSNNAGDLGAFVTVPVSGTPFGTLIDPSVRYVQYRISLGSSGSDVSPVLREIEIAGEAPVAIGDPVTTTPALMQAIRPNPTRAGASLIFALSSESHVTFDIFDAAGRQVFHRVEGVRGSGRHELTWDGRDSRGIQAAAGVYFIRLRAGAGEIVQRLVRIR